MQPLISCAAQPAQRAGHLGVLPFESNRFCTRSEPRENRAVLSSSCQPSHSSLVARQSSVVSTVRLDGSLIQHSRERSEPWSAETGSGCFLAQPLCRVTSALGNRGDLSSRAAAYFMRGSAGSKSRTSRCPPRLSRIGSANGQSRERIERS